jgi:hypothetical protein
MVYRRLDTKIQKGDTIEVKGSRVTITGKPAIIAAEVKKGDNVLSLGTIMAFLRGRDGDGRKRQAGFAARAGFGMVSLHVVTGYTRESQNITLDNRGRF